VLQHQGKIFSATFNPDGKLVLTGSNDRSARLWDTATGEAVGPVFRHQGGVTCVAFNPDGQSFATASNDKTAQTWEVPVAVEGEVGRLAAWTRVISGMELAPDTGLRVIDASGWRQLRQQLGIRRSGE